MTHPACDCPRRQHVHGTRAMYDRHACRCSDCSKAKAEATTKSKMRARLAPHGNSKVDSLHEQHLTALLHLTEQRDKMLDNGSTPPCTGDARYTSDDRDELAAAARECAFCPIRSACADVGRFEIHGVWGGVVKRLPQDRIGKETVAECIRKRVDGYQVVINSRRHGLYPTLDEAIAARDRIRAEAA